VHKDFRGQGYGEKLLRKAMEFCFEHNYHTVNFRGSEKMQSALQLCMRQGFQEQAVGELPEFKMFVLTKKLV
jgi:GNAT superfamily N-acetyltransferase